MYKWFVAIVVFFLVMCKPPVENPVEDPYQHILDKQAKEIIKASIEFSGGMETWNSIKNLSYAKDFSLLDAFGEVEKKFEQKHNYKYDPIHLEIYSKENENELVTTFDGNQYRRIMNDSIVNTSQEALEKAMNTSLYVVGIPFKLLDPGVELTYIGKDTLYNGKIGEVIEAKYNPSKHANHSTGDVWRYYFDPEDYRVIANWVQSADHANLIVNESYARTGGILFNQNRKSYRVDSSGAIEYLRAAYVYYDYNLQLKQPTSAE